MCLYAGKKITKKWQVDNVLIEAGPLIQAGPILNCSNTSRGLVLEVLRYVYFESTVNTECDKTPTTKFLTTSEQHGNNLIKI